MGRKKLFSSDRVLAAIQGSILERGVAPTLAELRHLLGMGSTRTVLRYLDELEEEGAIERWPGARGLRPLKGRSKGLETRSVPIVGEAPAGPFMLAEQNIAGWVQLPRGFVRTAPDAHFLLRVRGNSMNQCRVADDRIEDGDLVLVRRQQVARSGDVVVAVVDGEATIKRLRKGTSYWVLKPESSDPSNHPIICNESLSVQGVIVRVLKKGSEMLDLCH